jgi:hypothetical protein
MYSLVRLQVTSYGDIVRSSALLFAAMYTLTMPAKEVSHFDLHSELHVKYTHTLPHRKVLVLITTASCVYGIATLSSNIAATHHRAAAAGCAAAVYSVYISIHTLTLHVHSIY